MKKWTSKINRLEQLVHAMSAAPGHDNTAWVTALAILADQGNPEALAIMTDLETTWRDLMSQCPGGDDMPPSDRLQLAITTGNQGTQLTMATLMGIVQRGVAITRELPR